MSSQTFSQTTPSNTSAFAIVSLTFGILTWLVLPLFGALVAIVCGRLAIREINKAPPGEIGGATLARVGMLLARIQVIFFLLFLIVFAIWHM